MFEDFKHKILEHQKDQEPLSATLSQEVLEKCKQQGIDPDNITLAQLFPPCFDQYGSDISLMSAVEWDIMVAYAKTRKYLLENTLSHKKKQEC